MINGSQIGGADDEAKLESHYRDLDFTASRAIKMFYFLNSHYFLPPPFLACPEEQPHEVRKDNIPGRQSRIQAQISLLLHNHSNS